jgi:hypothetical protein
MDEILAVQAKYKGKKNHFNIKLKNGHGIHLKCDDQEDANAWTESLKALVEVYSTKKLVDFDISRKYKDKVDIRVSNMIMSELEGNNLKHIKPMIECSKFLEDKGIKSYLDELPEGY